MLAAGCFGMFHHGVHWELCAALHHLPACYGTQHNVLVAARSTLCWTAAVQRMSFASAGARRCIAVLPLLYSLARMLLYVVHPLHRIIPS
jgi:hypothetical protein